MNETTRADSAMRRTWCDCDAGCENESYGETLCPHCAASGCVPIERCPSCGGGLDADGFHLSEWADCDVERPNGSNR